MRFALFLLSIATVISAGPAVFTAGNAVVLNNSTNTFYLWVVGDSISTRWTINPSGGTYLEGFHRDPKAGGIAIKMTNSPNGLYEGAAQQIFAYNLDGDTVWYDLSTVFGDPFKGHRLEVTSETGESIIWPSGTHPGGSQVKRTLATENVWFTVYDAK